MPELEDLRAEVATISVVARYAPGNDDFGESAFDEIAYGALSERVDFIREALGDVLGPDYAVAKLTVDTTHSIEVVAIIAVAYKLLKNFNEVVETLVRARDHLSHIVGTLIYQKTPANSYDYVVAGHIVTMPADTFAVPALQMPLGYQPSVVQALPALAPSGGESPRVPRFGVPSQPTKWDRDAFLGRLVVPLVYLVVIAGLIVALIAAFRLI